MSLENEGCGQIYHAGSVVANCQNVLALFFNVARDIIEVEPVLWWNTFVNEEDEFSSTHHFPVVLDRNGEVYQVFGGNSLCVNYLGVVQSYRVAPLSSLEDHSSKLYYEFEGQIGRTIRSNKTMKEIGLADADGGVSEVEVDEEGELKARILKFVARRGA